MIAVVMPALPGKGPYIVEQILVQPGDVVEAGQELFSVETSKRAVSVKAQVNGIVCSVFVVEGDEVVPGATLAELEERCEAAATHGEKTPNTVPPETEGRCGESSKSGKVADAGGETADERAELLIIGGGTGGYVAALYAAKMGVRVTLVEREKLGGTCLNRGCIPTKTLISSALLFRNIMRASEWGIEVDGAARPRMDAIIARKDQVVDGLVHGIEYLMESNRIEVIKGQARFADDATAVVCIEGGGEREIAFEQCIIATGSQIRPLDLPRAQLPEVMDTDAALQNTELPASIAIVGGGVTGMEFAFMYSNLGVKVTLIARRPRLLHMFDEAVSEAIERSARDHDISIVLNADVKSFEKTADGQVRTEYITNDSRQTIEAQRVLVAGGRMPASQDLGLENTGVVVDSKTAAIVVDERMRTAVPSIYAIGDVNGLVMLAHAASYQGRIAVDDLLGRTVAFDKGLIPSVAYTDPEVATVGISLDEARRSEGEFSVGMFSFAHNGKALAENEAEGFVALVADAATGADADEASDASVSASDIGGTLRGATIVGHHASALIGYIGLALAAGLTGEDVRRAVFAHPTTSEAIHEAACDLTFGALHE